MTLRPFPIRVDGEHLLLLATVLTHTILKPVDYFIISFLFTCCQWCIVDWIYKWYWIWHGNIVDLVLIDQQSVGQKSLHLMDTVNAKKRWTTINWRVNNFWQRALCDQPCSWASIIDDMNDINVISCFETSDCHHCCSIA
jgi:hypothetical protein